MPLIAHPVILASQSPRRIELLKTILQEFEVIPSSVDEVFRPDRSPEENALALAGEKALSVARKVPGRIVIGADTIVVLNGDIIGKPESVQEAQSILRRLSGREHRVITGVAVVRDKLFQEAVTSRVKIKSLTEEEIKQYVDTGEPMDKAGAYAIQGKGAFMVAGYRGSWSNIVGLPLETVRALLKKAGCEV